MTSHQTDIELSTGTDYETLAVHVATLAGIAEAAKQDAAALVRSRTRVYSHGNAGQASDDAQIQQVVGEIAAWAYAAQAVTLQAAEAAQRAYEARIIGNWAINGTEPPFVWRIGNGPASGTR